MPLQAPIMLALCSMLSRTYYAGNYARIIAASLSVVHAEGFPYGTWHEIMHSVVHAEGFPWTHGSKCLPSISCKKNCLPVETQGRV